MLSKIIKNHIIIFLFVQAIILPSNRYITNIDDLKNAINSALPGDTITVQNGKYDSEGSITISNHGSEYYPIVIKTETIGGVELTGETYFDFRQCSYIILKDFVFTSTDVTVIKLQACNNIRITNNVFNLKETESLKWILIGGVWNDPNARSYNNRIDHNIFENKSQLGNFITIDGSGEPVYQSSQYDRIDHNYFGFIGPRHENEMEAIRVGWSELSMSSGYTVIEYNLFEECDGDPEIISVKTCDDTVRYNTFLRCQGTLSLRHGDRSVVEGNFFFGGEKSGTGGIRVYGSDHVIVNNYFEGLKGTKWDAPLTITNGDYDGGTNYSKHWRVNNLLVCNNTLIDNDHNIELGFTNNNKYTKPPRDIYFANNIIVADTNEIVKIITEPINAYYDSNIFFTEDEAVMGLELAIEQAYNIDPLLKNEGNIWKLSEGSPAIDSADNSYIRSSFDLDKQIRDEHPDIGADEFSLDMVLNKPLTKSDVGPVESEEPTFVHSSNVKDEQIRLIVYPNPFNSIININYSLSQSSEAELKVHTVTGEEVFNLKLVRNTNSVQLGFDHLSTGLYFIRIQQKGEIITKKILFLK